MKNIIFICLSVISLYSAKIKDIANVVGVRENQLIGYGLVVGLSGSGDGGSSEFTLAALSNMLASVNVKVSPNEIKSKNTAAVIVTAKLPAFARQGDKLDVSISSIGDAKSLKGGVLLMTPLKGVDGEIYAVAQGSLALGGKDNSDTHLTSGSILSGALVEREINFDIYNQKTIRLSLKDTNFKNSVSIEKIINKTMQEDIATAIDPRTIEIKKPNDKDTVSLLNKILDLNIDYESSEKIVIDERTGTIISGIDIEVEPVSLSHKDISLKIEPNSYKANQENEIDIKGASLGNGDIKISGKKTTIATITKALNRLGASPNDIIAILLNLKRAGAISADMEII